MYNLEVMLDAYLDDNLEYKFQNNIWTTISGEEIPLNKMGTFHIQNSINYIHEHGDNCVFGHGKQWLPKLELELENKIS